MNHSTDHPNPCISQYQIITVSQYQSATGINAFPMRARAGAVVDNRRRDPYSQVKDKFGGGFSNTPTRPCGCWAGKI